FASYTKNTSSKAGVRQGRFTILVCGIQEPHSVGVGGRSAGAGAQVGFDEQVAVSTGGRSRGVGTVAGVGADGLGNVLTDGTGSRSGGVGTVDGVGVDGLGEVGTDGTGSSFLGVGGAHQLAVLQYCAFTFQNLDHNRTGSHEADQILEEGAFLVLGVEAFGVGLGQLNHLGSDDAQTGLLETGQDLAGHVLGNGVGRDDGQGAFDGHETLQSLKKWMDR